MKKAPLILTALVIILAGGFIWLSQPKTSSPTNSPTNLTIPQTGEVVIIKITPDTYVPNKIDLKVGQTVSFENVSGGDRWPASNIHPTHEIYPEFDPKKPVPNGETWSFTFDKAGIWRFHDHLLPSITGTITVE